MSTTPETGQASEIARLKALYRIANARKYLGPETQDAASDNEEQKRAKAALRLIHQANRFENEAFKKRLQARLKDIGISKDEIDRADGGVALMAPALSKKLAKARTAILVVHGIGEQNPYETLDQFGRNLMRYLSFEGGINDLQIEAARYDHNDSTEARIRLKTQAFGPGPNTEGLIDIYEYYWAPQTEDKISYRETLAWLIKTTLTPIRLFNENLREMTTGRESRHVSDQPTRAMSSSPGPQSLCVKSGASS